MADSTKAEFRCGDNSFGTQRWNLRDGATLEGVVRHVQGELGVKTGPTIKLRRLTAKNKVEKMEEDDGVVRCHQGTPKSPSAALPGN